MKGEPVDVNMARDVIDWRAAHTRTHTHTHNTCCHYGLSTLRGVCLITESSQMEGLSA